MPEIKYDAFTSTLFVKPKRSAFHVFFLKMKAGFISVFMFSVISAFCDQVSEEHFTLSLEPEHEAHPTHHVGVFLGSATRFQGDGHKETGFTYGLEYEHKIRKNWGIGVLGESIAFSKGHRDVALAFPVSYYPTHSLKLSAGPGFESDGDHRSILFRFSVGYHFELGKFSLAPELALDLVDGSETLVYGVSIGRGF